jgi:hypothetical protein
MLSEVHMIGAKNAVKLVSGRIEGEPFEHQVKSVSPAVMGQNSIRKTSQKLQCMRAISEEARFSTSESCFIVLLTWCRARNRGWNRRIGFAYTRTSSSDVVGLALGLYLTRHQRWVLPRRALALPHNHPKSESIMSRGCEGND